MTKRGKGESESERPCTQLRDEQPCRRQRREKLVIRDTCDQEKRQRAKIAMKQKEIKARNEESANPSLFHQSSLSFIHHSDASIIVRDSKM